MDIVSEAIAKVRSSYSDESGITCQFYRIGNVGAKVYEYHDDAVNNHDSQTTLHKLGFAPKVLSEVIRIDDGNSLLFMFLTELAITVKEIVIREFPDKTRESSEYGVHFWNTQRFRHFAKLFQDMRSQGFMDYDDHWGNYGYLKCGRPVVIDVEFVHGEE